MRTTKEMIIFGAVEFIKQDI